MIKFYLCLLFPSIFRNVFLPPHLREGAEYLCVKEVIYPTLPYSPADLIPHTEGNTYELLKGYYRPTCQIMEFDTNPQYVYNDVRIGGNLVVNVLQADGLIDGSWLIPKSFISEKDMLTYKLSGKMPKLEEKMRSLEDDVRAVREWYC